MSYIPLQNINENDKPATLEQIKAALIDNNEIVIKETVKETRRYFSVEIEALAIMTAGCFKDVYERFDKIDKKFEIVDEKFDKLESAMNNRFNGVNARIDHLATYYTRRDEYSKLEKRVEKIELKLV